MWGSTLRPRCADEGITLFDASPSNLRNEIQAAITARDHYLSVLDNLVKQRAGSAYKDWRAGNADMPPDFPENHIHEYLSLTVPKLVFDNPRVAASSRRQGEPRIVAEALQAALNDWVDRVRLYVTLEDLANDILLMWAAAKVVQSPQPDTDGSYGAPHWPAIIRIPQRRFIIDPLCLCPSEAVYMGELIYRDKEELEEDAADPMSGWDLDAIENLATDSQPIPLRGGNPNNQNSLKRGQVAYYEIWVRNARLEADEDAAMGMEQMAVPGPEQGYNGVIYTIAESGEKYLRAPRPFYGPSRGPYYFAGIHKVVDSPWPLSPIVATYSQQDELNAQARAISLANRRYKRLIFVDGTDPSLVNKVKSGEHDFVIPVKSGLRPGEIVPVEIGGATAIQIQQLGLLMDRLNRVSGITEAQKGQTGDATATEASIADQASETRMAHCKRVFTDYVSELLRGVAWYLLHDDRVVIELGDEFASMTGMMQPVYFGGPYTEDGGTTFDDLVLDIEPYSMERTGEAMMQRNAMQAFQVVSATIPLMPTSPFVDWRKLFTDLGNATNNPSLARAFNWEVLGMMTGIGPPAPQQTPKLEKQSAVPAGGMGGQKPEILGDVTGQIAEAQYVPTMGGM